MDINVVALDLGQYWGLASKIAEIDLNGTFSVAFSTWKIRLRTPWQK